jgi:hypothetical protein
MSQQPTGTNNMENPGLIAGHAQYVKGAAEVRLLLLPLPLSTPPSIHFHHSIPLTHLNRPTNTHTPGDNRQRNRQPSLGDLRRARQEPSHRRDEGRQREQGQREPGAGRRGGDRGEDCGV